MLRMVNIEDFWELYILIVVECYMRKSVFTQQYFFLFLPSLACSASISVMGIEQSSGGEFEQTWKVAGEQQSFSPILSAEINSAEKNTWLYLLLTVKLRKLLACQFWKQNAWLMDHVLIQQDTCLYYRNAKHKTV